MQRITQSKTLIVLRLRNPVCFGLSAIHMDFRNPIIFIEFLYFTQQIINSERMASTKELFFVILQENARSFNV